MEDCLLKLHSPLLKMNSFLVKIHYPLVYNMLLEPIGKAQGKLLILVHAKHFISNTLSLLFCFRVWGFVWVQFCFVGFVVVFFMGFVCSFVFLGFWEGSWEFGFFSFSLRNVQVVWLLFREVLSGCISAGFHVCCPPDSCSSMFVCKHVILMQNFGRNLVCR